MEHVFPSKALQKQKHFMQNFCVPPPEWQAHQRVLRVMDWTQ
jgi:hypothetical protein